MALKHHTIILVPHNRARFRKWRISNRHLTAAVATVILLLIGSAFTTWSFFSQSIDESQLARLAEENRRLRQVNQEFESSIGELKGRLTDFEQRTRQLAIVAGIEGLAVEQESGVGGGDLLMTPASPGVPAAAGLEARARLLTGDLDTVEAGLAAQLRQLAATPSISPVRGILTSGYGQRRDPVTGQPAIHRAIDISTAPGRPVVATADGLVLKAERSGRLGNAVFVAHGYGVTTSYGHLAGFDVRPGQPLRRGDVIGHVGNTGRTTGYHLHYEVRVDGKPVNPMVYILDRAPGRS
jgi:murein DD-endopeptidase MepM/ murein hydrolase activator NlpD